MIYKMKRVISLVASMMFTIAAVAQESQGDVVTTVADKGESGMYIAALCPKKDVAIDNELVECFSIYTDRRKAYLLRMRIFDGQFLAKAGDCVIVKSTTEPVTIPLHEETSGISSVWSSDIICPSQDMSVEEFRLSHSLKQTQNIYLLTNMAKNGGFGFTKFTGDVMRKGNFFIVSPKISSTRAAVDIEDGDPVPFLEGEAGNDDGFTAQSVFAKGDANGDGKINVADIVEMVNYITGKPSTSFLFGPADVNSDKAVNTTDIELTLNTIMSKN